jgi:hypothetical protein
MTISLAACAGQPTPTFTYASSAAAIASAIKACAEVQEELVPTSATGIASLASCTISGKAVDVYSWKSKDDQDGFALVLNSNGQEAYYADGTGWTAVAHLDGDLAGQKMVAEAVVESIGQLQHLTGG